MTGMVKRLAKIISTRYLNVQLKTEATVLESFLWPRQQRKDGKWFGFDMKILAKKRGQYLDKGQFRAQYYNDPSDPDNVPVRPDKFQYFERKFLREENGFMFYKETGSMSMLQSTSPSV
jgi:hypothetical protein